MVSLTPAPERSRQRTSIVEFASLVPECMARLAAGGVDLEFTSATLTGPHFAHRVACTSTWLLDHGVRRDASVLIVDEDPEHTLRTFLACALIGAKPAVHAGTTAAGGRRRLAQELTRIQALFGTDTAILAPESQAWLQAQTSNTLVVPITAASQPLHRGLWAALSRHDIAYYQLSSGTTGHSKAIAVSWGALRASLLVLHDRMGHQQRMVHWMPLNHDFGFTASMMMIWRGQLLCVNTPTSFLRNPAQWLRDLTRLRADLTVCAPFALQFASKRLQPEDLLDVDLSALRAMGLGGEPVQPRQCRPFFSLLGSHGLSPDTFRVGYGLGEATCATHGNPAGGSPVAVVRAHRLRPGDAVDVLSVRQLLDDTPVPEGTFEVSSVGFAGLGVSCWLVDSTGNRIVGDGVCGEVVIDGATIADHYVEGPGVTTAISGSPVRTGDVGFVTQGQLYIVDRVNNLIIRHGCNYVARELEKPLADALGVSTSRVHVLERDPRDPNSALVALVERSGPISEDKVRDVLASVQLPVVLNEVVVLRGAVQSRTSSGKKRYAWLREALNAGELKVAIHVRRATTADRGAVHPVLQACLQTLGHPACTRPDQRLREGLGIDSVALVELGCLLETRGSTRLHPEDLLGCETVADLMALMDRPSVDGEGSLRSRMTDAFYERIPQTLIEVTEQRRRDLKVADRWIADFASCNYLGMDLHEDVLAAIGPAVRRWGVHPSWSRAVASPAIYHDMERALAKSIGADQVLVFPTITLLHAGVLPVLTGDGVLLVDAAAHRSVHDGAALAAHHGATVERYPHQDRAQLERLLQRHRGASSRIIAVDGVYSMSGAIEDLPALVELAKRYDTQIYVDDAHGLGLLGAQPSDSLPLGSGGGGVVQWHGLSYDRIFYVSGMSKAYSSIGAFITCPDDASRRRLSAASTFVYSGPVPVASLATTIAALQVNDVEGDYLRKRVGMLTDRLVRGARDLGLTVDNPNRFPIVRIVLGRPDLVIRACEILWDHGILLTPAVFPVVPMDEGGVRLSITSANTIRQIDRALAGLRDVRALLLQDKQETAG